MHRLSMVEPVSSACPRPRICAPWPRTIQVQRGGGAQGFGFGRQRVRKRGSRRFRVFQRCPAAAWSWSLERPRTASSRFLDPPRPNLIETLNTNQARQTDRQMMPASSSSSCCPCATVNGANSASRPTTTAVQPSSSSPSSPRRGRDAAAAAAEGAHPQARRGRRRQQRPRQQQGLVLLGLPVLVLLSLLLVLLLAGAPRAGAIQLDVDPYTTRVRNPCARCRGPADHRLN